MYILFLTHYFPPEVNAPASRTFENAKRWVKAGHRVSVLTCAPNHPNGIVYPGYENKLYQWDSIKEIQVLRVMTYLGANKGFAKRIANYISYLFSAVLFCGLIKHVDLVVSTSPQFFCGLAGYFVARRLRTKWVLEIRDLWPQSIIAVGAVKNKGIIRMLEGVETFMYRRADHIISVTNSFCHHITACGVPQGKLTVITNGADLETFRPISKNNEIAEQYGLHGKFVASFIGTHGMAHGLMTVIEAADKLRENDKILFLLVGDGAEKEKLGKQVWKMRLKNVLMLPQQPKQIISSFIAASDACMVLLKKDDLFKTVIPSKIFEAMAMERPIIMGVEGESLEILRKADCCVTIEPENSDDLVLAVLMLSENPEEVRRLGMNGRKFVEKNYNRERLAEDYVTVLQDQL